MQNDTPQSTVVQLPAQAAAGGEVGISVAQVGDMLQLTLRELSPAGRVIAEIDMTPHAARRLCAALTFAGRDAARVRHDRIVAQGARHASA